MTSPPSAKTLADAGDLSVVRQRLLAWFAENGRDLPWRRTRDPYHVLVSEIMLQQTQVDRVIPKYHAFLEQFPTLEALAAAPTADVIRAWAGLGYNRRAVNMQRTARAVLDEHGEQFPREVAALRRLPGIGPYTAGAVACFAFEQDTAFMDTNIRRVVQRVFVGPQEASEAQLLQLAETAVPEGQGWAWNQAIMELGALICTASNPACRRCPLQSECRDYAARRMADEQVFDTALAVGAPKQSRRIAEHREAPYLNSNRFYRGKIVEILRQAPSDDPLTLTRLGPQVKGDFTESDLPWLRGVVDGLARDGLVVAEDNLVRLP
jgi:A/G-specific adenine glycosylase